MKIVHLAIFASVASCATNTVSPVLRKFTQTRHQRNTNALLFRKYLSLQCIPYICSAAVIGIVTLYLYNYMKRNNAAKTEYGYMQQSERRYIDLYDTSATKESSTKNHDNTSSDEYGDTARTLLF